MNRFLLDNPFTRSMMFYPSKARPHTSRLVDVRDGTVETTDGIALGYRLYQKADAVACILCFHGNGETVADYDTLAAMFRDIGLVVVVAEYRGYGWSTGEPRGSDLLPDAEVIFNALPEILAQHAVPDLPLFIHGRSLGGAPAIHLTATYPEQVTGLIVESSFAHEPLLLASLGLPKFLLRWMPPLFASVKKIAQIATPLLLIHGELDEVIPVEQGQMLYDAAVMQHKTLWRVPNVGHNNLVASVTAEYSKAIQTFIRANIG